MARSRLSDLAAASGVSIATVSRALNGKPGVSDEARRAVDAAVKQLGYERAARTRDTDVVGLVVPPLTNPVFAMFVEAIESELYQRDVGLLVCSRAVGGPSEDEHVDLLLGQGVDGLVFVGGMHSDATADVGRYRRLTRRHLPFVVVNGAAEGIEAPIVSADDEWSITLAMRHLEQLGHRRIGLAVGPMRYIPTRRKVDAFVRAAAALGNEDPDGSVVEALYSIQGGELAAGTLIDSGHTAVVAGSDAMAVGALAAARKRGLRVPDDVSVIGYDDSQLIGYIDPPLTTVRQPVVEMASAAVSVLLAHDGAKASARRELTFRTELIVRGSTAPAAARS